ncbi:MAG: RNA polymerase sigma factor [Oscillospiraceae bacterium]|nr:RNA polymerase sigma factor [Oscillospiraceae bacterium]
MEDSSIIELYWQRQERAIQETAQKYGTFLRNLAWNILHSHDDAEECVNDTYLRAWNAIPPTRPSALKVWLGRITRNLSLDRWRKRAGGHGADILLGELDDCIPSPHGVEKTLEDQEIAGTISAFLRTLSREGRTIFLLRYWYGESILSISDSLNCSEGKVKSSLFRSRAALKKHLEKEGIAL